MDNLAQAKKYVEECEESAFDAISRVCRPLMMDGDGAFYAKNGNYMNASDVLKEHLIMQKTLQAIKNKLDVAKGLM